jgi:multiple sugar transport system substrate-binding protein
LTSLRGITWEHPRGYDCVVGAAKAYAELVPDVEVHWEYRSLQAFADAPLAGLSAGYDLMVIDHPHVPLAAEAGLLAPLDGAGFDDQLATLAEQSVGRSHASYAYRGHQYGLASDAAAHVAVYRPDLLAEPPRTWDAVLELATTGRVLWPAKPIDAMSSLLTLAANGGAPANAQSGRFLAADDALSALDLMHRLAACVPERNLGDNPIQVAEQLSTSDQWAYAPLLFGYTNYSRVGFRPGRLKYIDMPSRGTGAGGTGAGGSGITGSLLAGAGIAVSATALDLHAARAFALWLASAEVQRGVYFDEGGQPGNATAWSDPRLNAETWDFFIGTRASLDGAYLRPQLPGFIEFQDTAGPLVNAALRRELTDTQLVRRLDELADRLLVHR